MGIVAALCVDFYGVLSRVWLLQIHALLWCLYDSMFHTSMAGNITYNTETKKTPNAINNIYDIF